MQIVDLTGRSEEILVAASRLFARHSYANVTMEQVAAAVQAVPGALYHHFHDKEELIFQCYLRGLAIYRLEMEAAAERGVDGLETIRRFIRGRLRPEAQRMILFTDIDALDPTYSKQVHARRWQNAELLAGILHRGGADGSIACDEPLLTAVALISILDWVPFWFSERDYYTRQQAIDAVDDIITHGLYARGTAMPDLPDAPSVIPFVEARARLDKRAAKLDRMIAHEMATKASDLAGLADVLYRIDDIGAAISSGSFRTEGMLIAPCSVRSLSEIATGVTSSLLTRAADVILKERRKLVLMVRETPFHLGHLRSMTQVTEMGAIVMPPVPAFYTCPATLQDIVDHSVGRALDLLSLDNSLMSRWGETLGLKGQV